MKPIRDNDTIQIEITNFCPNDCANCTRLCPHVPKPFFMNFDYFKKAVDSLEGTHCMVGVMGGEPLYHPMFEEMSLYLKSRFPFKQCGLWTCFPEGKERYAELIADTYGNIFLNDHTRPDILHAPILVSVKEVIPDETEMWYVVDHCWMQRAWSASINPHGAFFCEIAASLSMLLGQPGDGWDVEKGWWTKSTIHYSGQQRNWCPKCGGAVPLKKRFSVDPVDDISPIMLERIKDISPKIKRGGFEIHNLQQFQDCRQMATYKDEVYRKRIADRYGLFIVLDQRGFYEPHVKKIEKRLKAV
jgi:hypothetical protein